MGAEPFSRYISGGRTRSVINLASPDGEGVVAYTFTGTTSAPASTSDGYANPGLQKNLHMIIKNNDAGTCKFRVYGYHSFAGEWGVLQIMDPADGGNNLMEWTVLADSDEYTVIPIEGIERIAVVCSAYGSGGSVTCYLGANTI
jgi:hypothetical protein